MRAIQISRNLVLLIPSSVIVSVFVSKLIHGLYKSATVRSRHLLQHAREYARVRGHGINEDGRTKSLTMPSSEAQRALMEGVIAKSHTAVEDIVFVEAHGTGTKVGDPIEANSIAASTVGGRSDALPIGSVKGHVGHSETAAGIVGLIKAALSLKNGRIPPTAGFERPNSGIDWEGLKLRVASTPGGEPIVPPASGRSPLISINSYGFGGSNGFAILSQAPPLDDDADDACDSTLPLVLRLEGATDGQAICLLTNP